MEIKGRNTVQFVPLLPSFYFVGRLHCRPFLKEHSLPVYSRKKPKKQSIIRDICEYWKTKKDLEFGQREILKKQNIHPGTSTIHPNTPHGAKTPGTFTAPSFLRQ
jgi:hypothetical protein